MTNKATKLFLFIALTSLLAYAYTNNSDFMLSLWGSLIMSRLCDEHE